MKVVTRHVNQEVVQQLTKAGINPLLAKLFAARGIKSSAQLETSLSGLIPPGKLTHH